MCYSFKICGAIRAAAGLPGRGHLGKLVDTIVHAADLAEAKTSLAGYDCFETFSSFLEHVSGSSLLPPVWSRSCT
jgi:hypothetical protein